MTCMLAGSQVIIYIGVKEYVFESEDWAGYNDEILNQIGAICCGWGMDYK